MALIGFIQLISPMLNHKLDFTLLRYVAEHQLKPGDRLPALGELSAELNQSTGKLREQLEVARVLGFVDVRPRIGIRLKDYDFAASMRLSVWYALALDHQHFEPLRVLRNHVEAAFWHEAAGLLTPADHAQLHTLVSRAWEKLDSRPVQIPHAEHRALHLTIFSHLENPFVQGLLSAYWDAYEAVGLSHYYDYDYLRTVWRYHEDMVQALAAGDVDTGHTLLMQHTQLLHYHPVPQAAMTTEAG